MLRPPLPAPDVPPSRTLLLARTAELERALREELSRRRPAAQAAWLNRLRRWWWEGLVVAAIVVVAYVAMSVSHKSFNRADWGKMTVSGLRIDGWRQDCGGPVMVGEKRRGLPVML